EFSVIGTRFLTVVKSSGPDRRFEEGPIPRGDDFLIWSSSQDYSSAIRNTLDDVVSRFYQQTKTVPNTRSQFEEAVRGASVPDYILQDAWNHPFYPVFRMLSSYGDRVKISTFSESAPGTAQRTDVTPVTRTTQIVALRSMGPDGIEATMDDFDVA